ncbi:MAG: hypothetical protein IJ192_14725 [Clostridia bacterium]|nr:hypothetical protein [Clostridia bacterium]
MSTKPKLTTIFLSTAAGVTALVTVLAGVQILGEVPIFGAVDSIQENTATYSNGRQTVEAPITNRGFTSVIVQRDIPCDINFKVMTGLDECNSEVVIPKYGIDLKLTEGDNIITIMPDEVGVFDYTCGMNMLQAKVTVAQSLDYDIQEEPADSKADETSESADNKNKKSDSQEQSKTIVHEDKETNMNDWMENQLMPGQNEDNASREIQTWQGWIFDRCCIGIDPFEHTKSCNLMGGCFRSGLGIIPYIPGKEFDTYTALDYYLNFDASSKALAEEFLRKLPDDWKNNVTVSVTGYVVNNIPASADELTVPETDESKVDHYLTGIHITKIEAAYIEGLSTNKLPEPNLTMTQQ